MSPIGEPRSFTLGHVAPTGWERAPGHRAGLLGTIAAIPASAGSARWHCAEFAESVGAPMETIDGVMLAVSEAVTNIVVHAYPGRRTGTAHITATLEEPGELLIVVADDGVGLQTPPPPHLQGHGLAIIEKLVSQCNISSSRDNGTRVEMTFRF